jgi:hypothetical protein
MPLAATGRPAWVSGAHGGHGAGQLQADIRIG